MLDHVRNDVWVGGRAKARPLHDDTAHRRTAHAIRRILFSLQRPSHCRNGALLFRLNRSRYGARWEFRGGTELCWSIRGVALLRQKTAGSGFLLRTFGVDVLRDPERGIHVSKDEPWQEHMSAALDIDNEPLPRLDLCDHTESAVLVTNSPPT